MYDHIGLKVRTSTPACVSTAAALGALGHELASRDESGAGLGPRGAPALWLYATTRQTGSGRACRVRRHRAARRSIGFTRRACRPADATTAVPGLRADYSPTYYAAFLIDPDGNNVEAVWME